MYVLGTEDNELGAQPAPPQTRQKKYEIGKEERTKPPNVRLKRASCDHSQERSGGAEDGFRMETVGSNAMKPKANVLRGAFGYFILRTWFLFHDLDDLDDLEVAVCNRVATPNSLPKVVESDIQTQLPAPGRFVPSRSRS